MNKTNYYYDDFGVYSHSYPARPEAAAPPANALWDAPPDPDSVPDDHVIVVTPDKSGWEIVPDYRGKGAYNPAGQWEQVWKPGPLPEGWSATPPPPSAEELTAQEQQQAQAAAAQIIQTAIQQQAVQTMSFAPTAFTVLAKAGLFEEWQAGESYSQGQRFVHQSIVYEAQQAVTAQAHQPPNSAGMLAVYRPISADPDSSAEPDGSRDNPIPFLHGMDVGTGQYYSFEGKVWLAKADMRPCVWNPGSVGVWQWEEIG